MRFAICLLSLAICCGFGGVVSIQADTTKLAAPPIIQQALSDDAKAAQPAIQKLRDEGPTALQRLIRLHQQLKGQGDQQDLLAKLETVIDRVGGQRYCSTSHLYWHTDLEKAKQAARASGKPILSLRMMGYLTDEFSCANSRFFRTTLYANKEISTSMRNQFVLHWQSVRPVPKVTIDFGDGRKLHRTLTGNSIHYVLDTDGKVIDGLPGLYGPKRFAKWLSEMTMIAEYFNGKQKLPANFTREMLMNFYHKQQLRKVVRQWENDLAKIPKVVKAREAARQAAQKAGKNPPAEKAARVAVSKSLVEMPIIQVVNQIPKLEKETDADVWEQIAALHVEESKLDEASIKLIRRQNPTAQRANRQTETKKDVEDPLLRLVGNLQTSIAVDTVRNEYILHRKLHQWLQDDKALRDVDVLNERVYTELFLTPRSDPWIGLVPSDIYSALENNGIEVKK